MLINSMLSVLGTHQTQLTSGATDTQRHAQKTKHRRTPGLRRTVLGSYLGCTLSS